MDAAAIVSKMSSISNFSNSVNGNAPQDLPATFQKVQAFSMQPDADDDDDDEPV